MKTHGVRDVRDSPSEPSDSLGMISACQPYRSMNCFACAPDSLDRAFTSHSPPCSSIHAAQWGAISTQWAHSTLKTRRTRGFPCVGVQETSLASLSKTSDRSSPTDGHFARIRSRRQWLSSTTWTTRRMDSPKTPAIPAFFKETASQSAIQNRTPLSIDARKRDFVHATGKIRVGPEDRRTARVHVFGARCIYMADSRGTRAPRCSGWMI